MIDFNVNQETCTKCGQCSSDCPARIITMASGYPTITQENGANCYRCQHCLSICPTASISILGYDPKNSLTLKGKLPDTSQMELLIKGRRAVRQYKPENIESDVMKKLLEVACYAPTGRNSRQVRFTVIDNRATLIEIRDEMMAKLVKTSREVGFPAGMESFSNYVKQWEEEGTDFIFRGAPHFIVASAPKSVVTPVEDCLIALTTFELYAQTLGIGTVWDGLAKWLINDLFPEFKSRLGIPEAMAAGAKEAAAQVQAQAATISGLSSYITRVTYGLPYPASIIGNRIAAVNQQISARSTTAITLAQLTQGNANEAGTRAQMITRMLPGGR